MIAFLLTFLVGGPTSLIDRYVPCRTGLVITYRDARGAAVRERVLGFVVKSEPRVCALRREVGADVETWGREHLADRVTNAGWIDTPLAMRSPILKAPLVEGASWRFNRQETRVVAVGRPVEVPAGRFTDTVWIESRAMDAPGPVAESVYAAGVGLVRHRAGAALLEAVEITTP